MSLWLSELYKTQSRLTVSQEANALENVLDDNGLENVQLRSSWVSYLGHDTRPNAPRTGR